MYPHTIRLRGPWEYELLGKPTPTPTAGSIIMPALLGSRGVVDYWGTVEFSRGFNWLAKLDDFEAVQLCLDSVVGRSTIVLNDRPLGTRQGVWGTTRFDVTELLRERNRLTIRTETPPPTSLGFDPYGSLGLGGEREGGPPRTCVAGILGDAWLSVEPAGLQVAVPTVEAAATKAGGELQVRTTIVLRPNRLDGRPLIAALTLDGLPIAEAPVAIPDADADAAIGIPATVGADGLAVRTWSFRDEGTPHLHELLFELRSGGASLYQQTWNVGFRPSPACDPSLSLKESSSPKWPSFLREFTDRFLSDDLLTALLGIGDVWPERSYRENTGEAFTTPFEQWSIAGFRFLRVRDHFAPDAFYSLCDRAGLRVIQDVPLAGAIDGWERESAIVDRLRRITYHPCVIGLTLSEDRIHGR